MALLAEEKACAQDGGICASIEYLAHTLSVNNPTGPQNRGLDRSANTLNQIEHWRRTPDVPTSLDSLSYHSVGSRRLRGSCLLDRSALVDPCTRSKSAWLPPKGDYHVSVGRCLHITSPKKRQHQVDRNRSVGEPSSGGQLLGDRCAGSPDRAQPAGLRYSRSELVPGYSAHPGLNNRRLQTTKVDHCGHPRAAYRLGHITAPEGSRKRALQPGWHAASPSTIVTGGCDRAHSFRSNRARERQDQYERRSLPRT